MTTATRTTTEEALYVIAASAMTDADGAPCYMVLTEAGAYKLDGDRVTTFLNPMKLHASLIKAGDYVDGRLTTSVRQIVKADGTKVARVTFAGRKTPVTLTGPQDVWSRTTELPARWIKSGHYLPVR